MSGLYGEDNLGIVTDNEYSTESEISEMVAEFIDDVRTNIAAGQSSRVAIANVLDDEDAEGRFRGIVDAIAEGIARTKARDVSALGWELYDEEDRGGVARHEIERLSERLEYEL